jgi:4-hydroxybenzoate polyprenyltransferase
MVALQAGIGATNDLVDAPRDAGHKPGKPIPAGLVSPGTARLLAIGAFAMGVALAGLFGGLAGGIVALLVIAVGLTYDLRLKGTSWSWLPFAIGIPILPVFGWLGATGRLPIAFVVLIPAAVVAGAALAIANALVDVERDLAVGSGSIAVALGPTRAWLVHAALLVLVGLAASVSVAPLGGSAAASLVVLLAATVPIGVAVARRGGSPARRERAWELEAVAVALLGIAWLVAVLS